jgi:hypothetical protein
MEVYKSVKIYPTNVFNLIKPQEILSQIPNLSDYKVNKQRHFAFTPTPLEKTKPALPGAKCIATNRMFEIDKTSEKG